MMTIMKGKYWHITFHFPMHTKESSTYCSNESKMPSIRKGGPTFENELFEFCSFNSVPHSLKIARIPVCRAENATLILDSLHISK